LELQIITKGRGHLGRALFRMELTMTETTILEGYLTAEQLAQQLGRDIKTIQRWRRLRQGPPFVKIGSVVLYRVEAVRNWLVDMERVAAPRRRAG
jgi:hypothetical protein